jgi:hypothetical protein
MIATAMQIAKNRMQFAAGKRVQSAVSATSKQSMSEYIDQKKEMFRVTLAQNTISHQIIKLESREF